MQTPKERFARMGASPDVAREGQMFRGTTRRKWKRYVVVLCVIGLVLYYASRAPEDITKQLNATVRPVEPASRPSAASGSFFSSAASRQKEELVLLGVAPRTAVVRCDGEIYTLGYGDVVNDWRLLFVQNQSAKLVRNGVERVLRLTEVELSGKRGGSGSGARDIGPSDGRRAHQDLAVGTGSRRTDDFTGDEPPRRP